MKLSDTTVRVEYLRPKRYDRTEVPIIYNPPGTDTQEEYRVTVHHVNRIGIQAIEIRDPANGIYDIYPDQLAVAIRALRLINPSLLSRLVARTTYSPTNE